MTASDAEVTEWWCPSEERWVWCPGPCPDGREHEPVIVRDEEAE